MGLVLDRAIPEENNDKVGNIPVGPRTFVDDGCLANKNTDAARDSCEKVSRALETVSLKANASKSVIVVTGNNKKDKDVIINDLNNNPVKLHNSNVNCVNFSDYLHKYQQSQSHVLSDLHIMFCTLYCYLENGRC